MPVSVFVPQKKDSTSSLLPIAGAVVGGIIGSRSGNTMGGASAGMGIGSAASGLMSQGEGQQSGGIPTSTGSSAMANRAAKVDSDPYAALAQANQALQKAPPEVQKEYEKPIQEALTRAAEDRRRLMEQQSTGGSYA